MPKPQLEDVEIVGQPEVKVDDSEKFSALRIDFINIFICMVIHTVIHTRFCNRKW